MQVSSSLMNEINRVSNNYYKNLQTTNSLVFLCSDSIPTRNKNMSYAQNVEAASVHSSRLAINRRRLSLCLPVLCIIQWPSSHRMALTKWRVDPHNKFIEKHSQI